jgi:hypothetical protein
VWGWTEEAKTLCTFFSYQAFKDGVIMGEGEYRCPEEII